MTTPYTAGNVESSLRKIALLSFAAIIIIYGAVSITSTIAFHCGSFGESMYFVNVILIDRNLNASEIQALLHNFSYGISVCRKYMRSPMMSDIGVNAKYLLLIGMRDNSLLTLCTTHELENLFFSGCRGSFDEFIHMQLYFRKHFHS